MKPRIADTSREDLNRYLEESRPSKSMPWRTLLKKYLPTGGDGSAHYMQALRIGRYFIGEKIISLTNMFGITVVRQA